MVDPGIDRGGRPVIGFAHRGARAEAQENTLAAFERALALGASGLESDAWLTADGVVVLDHDGMVRQGARRRPIATLRRDQLPPHIPTLDDLYTQCGSDYALSLDVKDPAAGPPIIAVARAAGGADRAWLCESDHSRLVTWRYLDEDIHLVDSTRLRQVSEGVRRRAARLAAAGIEALNLHERDWSADSVSEVHHEGVLAFGWDAQETAVLQRLVRAGIDAVYCDHPARMMAVLGRNPSPD